jgi:hypothetical protein
MKLPTAEKCAHHQFDEYTLPPTLQALRGSARMEIYLPSPDDGLFHSRLFATSLSLPKTCTKALI